MKTQSAQSKPKFLVVGCTARTHVWPSNRGLEKLSASGRAGQPIGFGVVLPTEVGDREIE